MWSVTRQATGCNAIFLAKAFTNVVIFVQECVVTATGVVFMLVAIRNVAGPLHVATFAAFLAPPTVLHAPSHVEATANTASVQRSAMSFVFLVESPASGVVNTTLVVILVGTFVANLRVIPLARSNYHVDTGALVFAVKNAQLCVVCVMVRKCMKFSLEKKSLQPISSSSRTVDMCLKYQEWTRG